MQLEPNPHGFPVPEGVYVCNKSRPMPNDRDIMGHRWCHVDAKPVSILLGSDALRYHCPHCGQDWEGEVK